MALAKKIGTMSSVRLRRDFTQLLCAIKVHALLHREHRSEKDGAIQATIKEDYAIVVSLMGDLMATAAEVKVREAVAQTVEVVEELLRVPAVAASGGVTVQQVKAKLALNQSSASRRLRQATEAGLLRNTEQRRGYAARYELTGERPADPSGFSNVSRRLRCATCDLHTPCTPPVNGQKGPTQMRKYRDFDDDEEEDDEPVRSRRFREDEDEDDDEPRRSRCPRYHEDEDDEDEYIVDPFEELESIVQTIDCHREQLNSALARLNQLLARDPRLEREWHKFQDAGGVSSKDLERFLDDANNKRSRLIPRRGHLRLVSNRPLIRRRLLIRKPSDPSDDAA